jgi:hypothetical protein
MLQSAKNILQLGIKELFSLRRDTVMMVLIVYAFTFAVYTPAQHAQTELRNASVAVADEDRSQLSAAIRDALLHPYFQVPDEIDRSEIDAVMDVGRYTFVIDFPLDSRRTPRPDAAPQCRSTSMPRPSRRRRRELFILNKSSAKRRGVC